MGQTFEHCSCAIHRNNRDATPKERKEMKNQLLEKQRHVHVTQTYLCLQTPRADNGSPHPPVFELNARTRARGKGRSVRGEVFKNNFARARMKTKRTDRSPPVAQELSVDRRAMVEARTVVRRWRFMARCYVRVD